MEKHGEYCLKTAIEAAVKASGEIMDVYNSGDFGEETKADNSPLTLADKRSHGIIKETLKNTPFPLLSEEGKNIPYTIRKPWDKFWLVDPVDGTKEFISRRGEFTVNIALIENQQPVLGIILVPVTSELYFAEKNKGAWKISVQALNPDNPYAGARSLKPSKSIDPKVIKVIASRSHLNEDTANFIQALEVKYQKVETMSKGSSLKFCAMAEGNADVYPRFGPTMEWDTGAGHAIALEAGLEVLIANTRSPLAYNKENLLNPYFIVQKPEWSV
jgi:3'(2'), 5'-bisphosphate nucleotidase